MKPNYKPDAVDNREVIRKQNLRMTMLAMKQISELPKHDEWRQDGAYVTEVIERILDICSGSGILPTFNQLASGMGVPKESLDDVRTGFMSASADVVNALTSFYQLCENTQVQATLDGGVDKIAGIFTLKSVYGYNEGAKEIVYTSNKLIGNRKDPKEIAKRYAEAVIEAKPEEIREAEYDF